MQKVLNSKYQFLDGPNSRGSELKFSLKVFFQLLKGFRLLHFIGPSVTVFGSARFDENHKYYKWAYQVGQRLSFNGFSVVTGGGPGIMEGANKGAYENGGQSIGCSIKLPKEQKNNPYLHKSVRFSYFFVRKVLLVKYSYAFIVMPGGYGTIDELFETLTLIQTGMIHNFPVVVMGNDYYYEIQEFIEKMIEEKTISPFDKKLILFTDNTDDAMSHIRHYIKKNYKVSLKKTKPLWWLGENKI